MHSNGLNTLRVNTVSLFHAEMPPYQDVRKVYMETDRVTELQIYEQTLLTCTR